MEPILTVSLILLWTLVIFNALITLALVRKVNKIARIVEIPEPDMLKVNTVVPEFTVATVSGDRLTNADFSKREKVMVFVSSQCAPCTEQMPTFDDLYQKAHERGVEMMIINLEDVDATRAYAKKLNFRAPLLSAARGENPLNEVFKVPGTPSFYHIDKNDRVLAGGFLDSKWDKLTSQW